MDTKEVRFDEESRTNQSATASIEVLRSLIVFLKTRMADFGENAVCLMGQSLDEDKLFFRMKSADCREIFEVYFAIE